MALKREAYKALEDIVGAEYITDEPAILDTYSRSWGMEWAIPGELFAPRQLAAILPASVEEVQAIVKVCNRYRVPFRAHATGFGPTGTVGKRPFVSIDLRRMNRILEIDERNMYAVVEPYVSFGILNFEAMKRGLQYHHLGVGPGATVLASVTSVQGEGSKGISASYSGRHPLGVEWVLPDGEILRLGSLGTGAGWFTGDGPGISLRGVMRGCGGAYGGLGVFTKAAVKLIPWYGPPRLETGDIPPRYEVKVPELYRVYTMTFPSREQVFEAFYLIGEEGIAHACTRRGPFAVAMGFTRSNLELSELWQKGEFQQKCAHTVGLILHASSPRELEFREKVFRKILEKTGGEIFSEPPDQIGFRFAYSLIGIGAVRRAFGGTGTFSEGMVAKEALDMLRNVQVVSFELKDPVAKQGKLVDNGDVASIQPYEDGTIGGHLETPVEYDPNDGDAVKAAVEFSDRCAKEQVKSNFAIPLFEGCNYDEYLHNLAGPRCMNYHIWIRKIKKAFDPNLVSESSWYTTPKE